MIAILNKAKGRVGVNAQAVIMVLLGLIVAKLYPDWWKGVLATEPPRVSWRVFYL